MAERGLQVCVLEQAATVASAASGNPIGLTFVRLTPHDSAQNRYYLCAYLHALRVLRRVFEQAGIKEGEHWRLNGILRVFDDAAEQAEIEAFLQTPGAIQLAEPMDAGQLSRLAGFAIDKPGIFQPGSGWLNPATLCRALLDHPNIRVVLNTSAAAIHPPHTDPLSQNWQVLTNKQTFCSDAVILANSAAISRFEPTRHLTLRTVRGQITQLPPAGESHTLQHAINYSGYLTPQWQGFHTVGATFHPKRKDLEETDADHAENIARLRGTIPGFPALPVNDAGHYTGRVAFRAGTPDYLPYVGPAPDACAYEQCYREGLGKGQLKRLYPLGPVHPHLYVSVGHGSRGITSTLLASEVLCHWMFQEPAPVDNEILHALHPARFLIRHYKRRQPV